MPPRPALLRLLLLALLQLVLQLLLLGGQQAREQVLQHGCPFS